MTSHVMGCCCPTCASAPAADPEAETGGNGGSITAGAPLTKPVYSEAEVVYALTTSDGTFSSVAWSRDQISFSIESGQLFSGDPDYQAEHEGYTAMTPAMVAAAQEAFRLWDDLIAVELIEVQGQNANILFNRSTATSEMSYARYDYTFENNQPRSTYTITDAEIWMYADDPALNQDADFDLSRLGFNTYLHEIGHALGVTHPGQYNISANWQDDATHYQDTRQYTVMSYFDAEENGSGTDHIDGASRAFGATPLLHDILTAQAIYGADMTTRTGDTVYGFGSTAGRDAFDFTLNVRPVVAIWDAGGQDTLDLSGFSEDQVIDLAPGAFSSAGPLTGNLAIAYGADIEHATGGAGRDLILGNALINLIRGGAGDDTIEGGDGGDILYGNGGADRIDGGAGSDSLRYNTAAAAVAVSLQAGTGTAGEAAGDTVLNFEDLQGSGHDDSLTGSVYDNRIDGNDGADLIDALSGHDFLLGGAGDDTILGGFGNDLLRGGAGADRLDGGDGLDWVQYHTAASATVLDLTGGGTGGEAAGDVFVDVENVLLGDFADRASGTAVKNQILGGAGNDWIDGRGGNDILTGEAGDDTLLGGDDRDYVIGGAGADLLDGGASLDWVEYATSDAAVTIDLEAGTASGGHATGDLISNVEFVLGSGFADSLAGDAAANILRGGAGDDTIDGGTANDVLDGNAGADVLVFNLGDGVDRVHGYELGLDRMFIQSGAANYGELDIYDWQGDAAVAYGQGSVILLTAIDHTLLSDSDFLFA